MQHLSLRESSTLLDISLNTLLKGRHKVLSSLDKYYAFFNYFIGYVQIDEAYFPFSTKVNKKACRNLGKGYVMIHPVNQIYRASKELHQRCKDSNKRGISGEKVCSITALTMSNF